jgi:hypothetical protein
VTHIDRSTNLNRESRPAGVARRRLLALGLGLVAVIPGCGGDPDELPAVPAGGTVTYQGKPVESGTIQFVPEKGRPAGGKIEGGRFTLTTYKEGDGAISGKHGVGVTSLKQQAPAQAGAEPEMISAIDKKFSLPTHSGLSAEVPAGGKTDLQIDIK